MHSKSKYWRLGLLIGVAAVVVEPMTISYACSADLSQDTAQSLEPARGNRSARRPGRQLPQSRIGNTRVDVNVAYPFSQETLRLDRKQTRDASPLVGHAYDRAGAVSYLEALNRQLLVLESVASLLQDYRRTEDALSTYRDKLESCVEIKKAKLKTAYAAFCADEIDSASGAVAQYYAFVGRVGSYAANMKLASAGVAMDPFVSKLGRAMDEIQSKKLALAE